MNKTVLLSGSQKAAPILVVRGFCRMFRLSYVKVELLDLLEAVITYEGGKKMYNGNLVLFYRHIDFFFRLAYSHCAPKKVAGD